MEEFLHFLQGEMEKPGLVSWFHFGALILIIASSILIPWRFRNAGEKTYKRILLGCWLTLLVLEAGKQILLAFHYGSPSYWEYSYRDFPFSICSMIYYFAPIILFMNHQKHPKIVDAAVGYLCFISLVGGLLVCVYSDMVTSRLIYINIQTFLQHGSQVVIGVLIFIWKRKTITIKTFYRSMIAFLITVVIAIAINLSFQPHFINMFFINPMIITNLPVGNIIQEKAGYPVYLLCFLLAMALVAFLAYFTETSISKAIEKKKAKAGK
ncbi:MAG: YwaF family protein [Bacilli bacterium]|nr:YwaF family protein [Bacilli bacterium]